MNTIDDTMLAAFMDGELDGTDKRAVEVAIDANPTLRSRLERLRSVDGLVRAAFAQVADLRTPPLRAPVVAAVATRGPRTRWQVPLAAAASLLVLVATGAGFYHLGQQEQRYIAQTREVDAAAAAQAFQRVTESELSGTTVKWRSPRGDSTAEFTPVRTWRTETGRYCREFSETRFRDGVKRVEGGIACRGDDGSWKVRVRYFPD